jgi:hypothetical protein
MQTFIFWAWMGTVRNFVTVRAQNEEQAKQNMAEACKKNGWRLVIA